MIWLDNAPRRLRCTTMYFAETARPAMLCSETSYFELIQAPAESKCLPTRPKTAHFETSSQTWTAHMTSRQTKGYISSWTRLCGKGTRRAVYIHLWRNSQINQASSVQTEDALLCFIPVRCYGIIY